MMCEQLIKNYSQKSSFKYIILRYFNVVGAEHNIKIWSSKQFWSTIQSFSK